MDDIKQDVKEISKKFNEHEVECAQFRGRIDEKMTNIDSRMTKVERILYGILAALLLGVLERLVNG